MEDNEISMDSEPLKRYGKNMVKYIKGRLRDLVGGSMIDLQRDIRTNRFIAYDGGRHDNLIMRRSGHLSNSIRPTRIEEPEDGVFTSGLQVGKVYGKVLIGRRGKSTVITPKNSQFLAIPLPAALGNHGVPKGRPRDKSLWGNTFIRKGIIFGQPLYVKGQKQGQSKGMVVPLFVLKRSVTIPVKIAVEDLREFTKAGAGKEFEKIRNDLGMK
jgi:hypothetical protein